MNLDIKSIKEYLANNPVAICAFLGWNDAGGTASNVVDHLIEIVKTNGNSKIYYV